MAKNEQTADLDTISIQFFFYIHVYYVYGWWLLSGGGGGASAPHPPPLNETLISIINCIVTDSQYKKSHGEPGN